MRCWIAPRDVGAGQSYAAAIVEAIGACEVLVLVLSRHSVASPHVLREVERASSKQRPILPVRIDTVALTPDLEYFLSTTQWLDAPGGALAPILPAVLAGVRRRGAPTGGAQRVADGAPPSAPPSPPAAPGAAPPPRGGLSAGQRPLALVVAVVVAGVLWFATRSFVSHPGTPVAGLAPGTPPATAPSVAPPSVAVLPFEDLSEKKDQGYFSDGLSDELIDLLGKVPGLRVPARTSSFYFKGKQVTLGDIAKALGVTTVLEGSVRRAGNRLRVTAELVRVDGDERVWSQSYDRKLDDVFRVQDEIAGAVVGALKLKLLAAPAAIERPTVSTAAYNQYLMGRQFLGRFDGNDARRAAKAFRDAIALDPNFAGAWAGLADAQFWAADAEEAGRDRERTEEVLSGRDAADRALALDPALAYGLIVRGRIRASYDLDFAAGGADFRRALELSPGNVDALIEYATTVLVPTGHRAEAIEAFDKAMSADPLNARAYTMLAWTLEGMGEYAPARAAAEHALQLSPDQSYATCIYAATYVLEGKPAVALEAFDRTSEIFRLYGQALAQYDLGARAQADEALAQLIAKYGFSSAYQIAEVYGWRGDVPKTVEWLKRARAVHDPGASYASASQFFRKIRSDPRFIAQLHDMHLS